MCSRSERSDSRAAPRTRSRRVTRTLGPEWSCSCEFMIDFNLYANQPRCDLCVDCPLSSRFADRINMRFVIVQTIVRAIGHQTLRL